MAFYGDTLGQHVKHALPTIRKTNIQRVYRKVAKQVLFYLTQLIALATISDHVVIPSHYLSRLTAETRSTEDIH